MNGRILIRFILEIIGATIVWMLKGFKGKMTDQMSSPNDGSIKGIRNFIVSVIFIFVVILIMYPDTFNTK